MSPHLEPMLLTVHAVSPLSTIPIGSLDCASAALN